MTRRIYNRSTLKVSTRAKHLLMLMFKSDGQLHYVIGEDVFFVSTTRLGPECADDWASAVNELADMMLIDSRHDGTYTLSLAGGKAAVTLEAAMQDEVEEASRASGVMAL